MEEKEEVPCAYCNAETRTEQVGPVSVVNVYHDLDCPWMNERVAPKKKKVIDGWE